MGVLTANQAVEITRARLWPLLRKERERVARIDKWLRWDHDKPHQPRHATREYKQLASQAQAPWGRRVVSAVTDQLYVDGLREAKSDSDSPAWDWWNANGYAARQIALHEATVGYGLAYNVVLPGKSWLGEDMPVIRSLDPSQMVAVYADPAWDDWPEYALRAEPQRVGDRVSWRLRLYDDVNVHHLVMTESGDSVLHTETKVHDTGVCPVVRFTNHLDLRGRADGDIEPIIPLLGRIDQTTFDRLIVQRFASWKVRTIAGMSIDETVAATGESPEAARLRLLVNDILVAENKDTKFGTLDETPLDGFINAHDADVRVLAAVSQSPAHELIGQMANLSAEALAAAEVSLTRRAIRVKHPVGESHKQTFRLSGKVMRNEDVAKDLTSEVVWRDMESRSLSQAADALGKMAEMLAVPVELLWEDIPGWTQDKVERAKLLVQQGDSIGRLLEALKEGATSEVPALWTPPGSAA